MIYPRIRDLREDRDLTQRAVAEYLHVAQRTYSSYENGSRSIPVQILVQLACYYHTSTDYLLAITDEFRPYPPSRYKNKEGCL